MGDYRSALDGAVDGKFVKASGVLTDDVPTARVVAFKVRDEDLTAGAVAESIVLAQLPAGTVVLGCFWKLNEEFSGGSATSVTMQVGRAADPDGYIAAVDCFTGAGAAWKDVELAGRGADAKNDVATTPAVDENSLPDLVVAAENLVCRITSDVNVNLLTAGELEVHVVVVQCANALKVVPGDG